MIPVTVYVPENRLEFFNELLKNLQFEQEIINVPAWHNEIIDQRIQEFEESSKDVMNWDDVKHSFKLS